MKKLYCDICKENIKRDQGIVIWDKYNGDCPVGPLVVHKSMVKPSCDKRPSWNYSYEITDFIKDFPNHVDQLNKNI